MGKDSAGGADSSTSRDLDYGQLVEGRYKVLYLIGRGAGGAVYAVEQVFLQKRYALKVLDPIVTSDVNIRRFQQEAQTANQLDHPNLVRAVDCGVIDGTQPYLVMELVEGETLDSYLKSKGKLSVDLALELFIQLCFGLGYAHSEGVIHRDIKPSNIILMPAEGGKLLPKIVDFGIAKVALMGEVEAQALTNTGEVFGTPLYMSPEQCNGVMVDARSDIYSLGCVLFEALTLTPPFCGKTALETIVRHQADTAPSLKEASLGEKFPQALEAIVDRMLAKKPDDRYPTALEAAQDLSNLQQGQSELIGRQQTVQDKSVSKSKLLIAAAVSGLLVVVSVSLFYALRTDRLDSKASPTSEVAVDLTTQSSSDQEKPFSVIAKDLRVFTFPTDEALGVLRWWRSTEEQQTKAQGTVSIPADAPLVFECGEPIYKKPSYLTRFQSNELTGIIFALKLVAGEEHTDESVRLLPFLNSLKMVSLTNNTISDESVGLVGALPKLRWLLVDESYKSGEKLATLSNLPKLRVLVAHDINSPTALLKQLAKTDNLRRLSLSLNVGKLTGQDVELISQLHKLTTLSILSDLPAQALNRLCSMTNLRKLCLLANAIDDRSIARLKGMKNLEELTVLDPTDDQVELLSTLDRIKQLRIPVTSINSKTAKALKTMRHLQWLRPMVGTSTFLNSEDDSIQLLGSNSDFKIGPIRSLEGHSPVYDWFENYLAPESKDDLFG